MSFHEGSKWQERQEDNKSIGGCGKHKGQSLINCPLCLSEAESVNNKQEPKTLQELAIEHNLSGKELMLCSCYLVALRMYEKGIKPEDLMRIVDNWERINKAINILKHDFND